MKGSRDWGLGISKIAGLILALFLFLYPIPYTLYPVHAAVDISKDFGFGNITTLGQGTSQIITPLFSVAAALVVIYFLLGTFKYLKAGASKEDIEGARQMIQHAIVGFMLLMFSFLVLQFLLSSIFGSSSFQIF